MKLLINGNVEAGEFSTVTNLLSSRDLDPKQVLVELNGSILPRNDYDKALNEGDVLELVHFVAGG